MIQTCDILSIFALKTYVRGFVSRRWQHCRCTSLVNECTKISDSDLTCDPSIPILDIVILISKHKETNGWSRDQGGDEEPEHKVFHKFEIQISSFPKFFDIWLPIISISRVEPYISIVKRKLFKPPIIYLSSGLTMVNRVDHFGMREPHPLIPLSIWLPITKIIPGIGIKQFERAPNDILCFKKSPGVLAPQVIEGVPLIIQAIPPDIIKHRFI